jgi:hypothetical protein
MSPVLLLGTTDKALFHAAKVKVWNSLKTTTNENSTEDIKAVMSNPKKMKSLSISIRIMLTRNYHSGITTIVNFLF